MSSTTTPRRHFVKKLLAPVLGERSYSVLQAVAMGWDIKRGAWWEPELELIARVVREGDTAIDIGANFGLWAYYFSKAVGPSGKVYSFEPIPFTARTFRLIARVLGFSQNVELVTKGCGAKNETVKFTVPVMDTGAISAGLVHMRGRNDERPGRDKHAPFPKTKDIECEVVAIDDYLPQLERVSLVKCDIEGADLFAMRGAVATLKKHKPVVVIEITPWFLEGFGLRVADVVSFFEELGYRCYAYDDGGRLVPTATDAIIEDNWVFVHPENDARVRAIMTEPSRGEHLA
ncbi:MAG: FkbM family methyltransferase [Labilithrix sp.]|nr:FkbM family methyltransferase [Labilithrix sp.]MCW5814719.1 FkbM family methyltransferase [Labilithrix sp.]